MHSYPLVYGSSAACRVTTVAFLKITLPRNKASWALSLGTQPRVVSQAVIGHAGDDAGSVEGFAWDAKRERLAVALGGSERRIAVFAAAHKPILTLRLLGVIPQASGDAGHLATCFLCVLLMCA